MGELAKESNTLLYTFEKADTGITFLSFLLLEYHVSTENYEKYSKSIMDFYGFTITQLTSSYSELNFNGYIRSHRSHVDVTEKAKKLIGSGNKVVNSMEVKRLKDGFERYWKGVPKKVNKLKAKRIWDRLKPSEQLVDKIATAVEKQSTYKAKMDSLGKFQAELQQPDRWLTNQRWEDFVPETKSVIKKTKPQRDER